MKKRLFNLLNCKLTNLRKSLKFTRFFIQSYIRTMKKKLLSLHSCLQILQCAPGFHLLWVSPNWDGFFLCVWCSYLWAICSPVNDPLSILLKLISINWLVHQAGPWWYRCFGWPSIPSLGWTDICLCLPQKSVTAKLKLRTRSPSTLTTLSNVTLWAQKHQVVPWTLHSLPPHLWDLFFTCYNVIRMKIPIGEETHNV